MIRVFLENLQLVAPHGVYEEERREGRTFRFDLVATVERWTRSDDPAAILDYRRLSEIVHDVVLHGPSRNLIETLAADITDRCFADHPTIVAVSLEIRKRATGVPGDPEWVGCAISLDRDTWQRQPRSD